MEEVCRSLSADTQHPTMGFCICRFWWDGLCVVAEPESCIGAVVQPLMHVEPVHKSMNAL